ncbi:sensor histidine kinase [Calidifontibacter terrae]
MPVKGEPSKLWRRVRTTALVMATVMSVTLAMSQRDARIAGVTVQGETARGDSWSILLWLVGVTGCVLVVWRRRWPLPLALGWSAITLLFPIDGSLPLVGVFAVATSGIAWRVVAPVAVFATIAVGVSVHRDVQGYNSVQSFWRTFFPFPAGSTFPWAVALAIPIVLVAICLGGAVLLRGRRQLATSTVAHDLATDRIRVLDETVARQAERERIAREIHDALGHRLSLLNLHAGALELAAADNPRLQKSARVIRESAGQSMIDLRSLLELLRRPDDPDVARALRTLSDLPTLIDESLAAGSPVASSIFIDDSSPLDERVSHSIFRITQELLTNARKHSPGATIRLHLDARPANGIEISTTNLLPQTTDGRFLPGHGLNGIHERVKLAGGESWAWVDDTHAFRFLVKLPWQFSPVNPSNNAAKNSR